MSDILPDPFRFLAGIGFPSLDSDITKRRINLHSETPAAQFLGGDELTAGARERFEADVSPFRMFKHRELEQPHGLLRGV